ncbi:AGE family epimerase/isomerase [Sphaerochaeta globosa]|uniref:N-acylglucosamine 2-epimerase n=1 Tax=Sphaerochaeta globosa (strain ATCC BAA-1886 / DSM 22777 / Buddy) TaxID=158189 RepID=F0RRM7_SPHGB|nr:AGE family epimerase/isomerase [Sphaerochaeta globosa]ADY14286.1 N-acylglucosamine 2-epimerase [Sphaerochaeta globosa str. Buddy]
MNTDDFSTLTNLSARAQHVLGTNILPFWKEALFDEQNQSFYSYIDQNRIPDKTRPLNAILLTRMLWAYSAVYEQSGDTACLKLADAAYKTLLNSFRDPLYGGIFYQIQADSTPLVLQKRIFAQAFYIIALARYSKATGSNEALLEASNTHQLLLQHAQIVRGGFTDTLTRDWRDEVDEHFWWMNNQGAPFIFNSQLHMLEAAIELQEAAPSEKKSNQIKDQITFILQWFLDCTNNHLFISISDQAKPMDETINFSNELETAYLLRRAARLCGDEKRVDQLCTTLVRNVMHIALDETHGGLFFSSHVQHGLNRCKVWYVHAEAMVALLDAYEATNENCFLNWATEIWKFIEQHLVDWDGGEWFSSAKNPYTDEVSIQQQRARDSRTGKEKASAYKCPYHTVRACLEINRRVKQLTS